MNLPADGIDRPEPGAAPSPAGRDGWRPTKFEQVKGRWRMNRQGGIASRLIGDLQVAAYQASLERFARGRLIDLGCGNAPLAGIYGPLVKKFEWADWPNSLHRQFPLDHELDLNRPLPLPGSSYDTVLLSDVLEHIAEPDLLFGELARILTPGGHLLVGVPFFYWLHEEPHDYHRYTRFKLAHFGTTHGLDVVEIAEVGGAIDSWCDLSMKLLSGIWGPLAGLAYYPWSLTRRLPPLARVNRKAAWRFPLAYMAVYRRPA